MAPRWSMRCTAAKTTNSSSRSRQTAKSPARLRAPLLPELERSEAAQLASYFSKGFGAENFHPAAGNISIIPDARPAHDRPQEDRPDKVARRHEGRAAPK